MKTAKLNLFFVQIPFIGIDSDFFTPAVIVMFQFVSLAKAWLPPNPAKQAASVTVAGNASFFPWVTPRNVTQWNPALRLENPKVAFLSAHHSEGEPHQRISDITTQADTNRWVPLVWIIRLAAGRTASLFCFKHKEPLLSRRDVAATLCAASSRVLAGMMNLSWGSDGRPTRSMAPSSADSCGQSQAVTPDTSSWCELEHRVGLMRWVCSGECLCERPPATKIRVGEND